MPWLVSHGFFFLSYFHSILSIQRLHAEITDVSNRKDNKTNIMENKTIIIQESTYDDIRNIQSLWADEDVMRFIWPGGLHETEEGVREYLDRIIDARPKSNYYSIFYDGKYCGETQYKIDESTRSAALDIKLFKFAQGRGIATKALTYSIQEAFKHGALSVWVDPHPLNEKALRLYHKLGFVQKEMPEHVIALGEDPNLYVYLELRKE